MKNIFLYFILFNVCAPVKVHVGRLGPLVGVSSLLPLCVFGDQTQNSGWEAWWQAPLTTEPSGWLTQ